MAVQIKQYVELRGASPLDAVISGQHYKAYLVANLAFLDGPDASANHYKLSLAEVYGAMAFYQENVETIEQALEDARKLAYKMGATNLGD